MSYLVDTNVLSELRRKAPDAGVLEWFAKRPPVTLYLSVLTLGEIRSLLHFKDAPEENCAEVNGLLDEHIGHVAVRIRELKALQKELKALREQCVSSQTAADCGILSGLEKAAQTSVRDSSNQGHSGHVHGAHRQIGL